MPKTVAVPSTSNETLALPWACPGSYPGAGPHRGRRLVEQFGGARNIFKASLTELEAADIQASSAQSLGTGHSMELAHDEMGRVRLPGYVSSVWRILHGDFQRPGARGVDAAATSQRRRRQGKKGGRF